eukprot:CAMPEP_0172838278 /NCGR_PEP_ID=MMETSP1075-20121228/27761_1 /TAXON_ID=2916 /ORGANISM="Ceratium fusus, Strain PA161109" /LENGTH=134 /DNA_ID=CAMNT_0013681763 /DNA_START=321 /DNA_END=725 /DNA_ORIENTATION=+
MSRENKGLCRKQLAEHRKVLMHLFSRSLEKLANTTYKEAVPSKKHGALLRGGHPTLGLRGGVFSTAKEHHMPFGVPRREEYSHFEPSKLQLFTVLEPCCGAWRVIEMACNNVDARELLCHTQVAACMVEMVMSS